MIAMCIVGVLGVIGAGVYVAIVPESERRPQNNRPHNNRPHGIF